jgi:hypothetical protein
VSIDYGERERQFIEALKGDTGRTLEEWMTAIAAEGLTQRNDIIDWLRRQKFMFSKASWLERIHNNGGQPIYSGTGSPRAQTRPRTASAPRLQPLVPPMPAAQPPAPASYPPPQRPSRPQAAVAAPSTPPQPPPAAAVPSPPPKIAQPGTGTADPAALDALLARAKAFRPLAAYLIAEIRKAVPDITVSAHDGFVGLRVRDKDFAVLAISPKELRLGLALKSRPQEAALEAAKLPALRGAPPVSHMAILNDARQITPSLLAAIAQAAADA